MFGAVGKKSTSRPSSVVFPVLNAVIRISFQSVTFTGFWRSVVPVSAVSKAIFEAL